MVADAVLDNSWLCVTGNSPAATCSEWPQVDSNYSVPDPVAQNPHDSPPLTGGLHRATLNSKKGERAPIFSSITCFAGACPPRCSLARQDMRRGLSCQPTSLHGRLSHGILSGPCRGMKALEKEIAS
ncbi:unnamed protein product [Pleuronectes platessa]|uniref:Uncharacterized protein n=1 Tax=Pleuronectes platessa TaxID=8262 RepID=A0A9N7V5G8_PLEPL|nr:unnamed protein product [Pleuronectes platessa]